MKTPPRTAPDAADRNEAGRIRRTGVKAVLLDIEGTTCPVSFVAETLFPYARKGLGPYLERHGGKVELQALQQELRSGWAQETDPEAVALRCQQQESPDETPNLVPYLHWLIRCDRKDAALKELQGMVWAEGYALGALQGPLYPDVPEALRRWHGQGLGLAVYSSGSVAAQQLLYGHSTAGDLRALFSHWFDTRTGPKQDASSYLRIVESLGIASQGVLFISDAIAELNAAAAAGLQVLFSDRPGNPQRDGGGFERIGDYGLLELDP
jgi:enolase-phosphatase E1